MNNDIINKKYEQWLKYATEDADIVAELASMKGNFDEIKESFALELAFGTAGLRGIIGAGTFRLNIYTIRRATQGFANYLNKTFSEPKIAIAYDSRIKSDLFAKEAARVLSANNIKVYLYPELVPTPMLSFAVRELKCSGGINVTASHNPAKYNGYKVYGNDGCQITEEAANLIINEINSLSMFEDIKLTSFEKSLEDGKITYISDEVYENYFVEVKKRSVHKSICEDNDFSIVYTPLNGAGNKPVRKILDMIGLKNVSIVKEQELPDGNFPTCPFPNPEIKEALQKGLDLCEKVKPDLLLATDPDCDRVGIAAKSDNGEYKLFSGNEVGALLLEYICRERLALGTMPKNPIAIKTIVTSDICKKIASEYDIELINVLTGFKYIGEQIAILEAKGEEDRFILGFEESYGYLSGSYVRDKDAVVASMLICEMAAFYKSKGISLVKALENLYNKYGVFFHTQKSTAFEGVSGMEEMQKIMNNLQNNPPKDIADLKITVFEDYKKSVSTNLITNEKTEINLPKSNVLSFFFESGDSVIIRPSGTEPKIKVYYTCTAKSLDEAKKLEEKISNDFIKFLKI